MNFAYSLAIAGALIFSLAGAGCISGTHGGPAYSVDQKGVLAVTCAEVSFNETVLSANETLTFSRIVMHIPDGDVVIYLSSPKQPKAAVLYIPGAGEKMRGHADRMVRYAAAGYAFMFVDPRGNGAETPGIPFSEQLLRQDYSRFSKDNDLWPQYYQTICDISSARQYLSSRLGVPVYAAGSSNGGRYAAVATGVDRLFAGYIGISTTDWGILESVKGQGTSEDIVRYTASLEPSTYLTEITPRPVWVFHAKNDPVIPFESGKTFFDKAGEPKKFIEFTGSHGINSDTDEKILYQLEQIYGTGG
jgi:dienelactone hydrolase